MRLKFSQKNAAIIAQAPLGGEPCARHNALAKFPPKHIKCVKRGEQKQQRNFNGMQAISPIINVLKQAIVPGRRFSEHELIKLMSQQGLAPFDTLNLSLNSHLFSAHFLMRHCLYHLQDEYAAQTPQHYILALSALGAQLFAYERSATGASKALNTEALETESSALRAYYLDIRHYFETTEEQVDALLNSFWQRYLSQDDVSAAYQSLELAPGASLSEVKSAYRRLAQSQHPDKGGNSQAFAKISAAKRLLVQHLS